MNHVKEESRKNKRITYKELHVEIIESFVKNQLSKKRTHV